MTPELNDGSAAVQEHPEELPDEQEPESPYGERNEELPEQLQNAIRAAILEFQKQDVYDRRREVLRDRRNRFYERGYQHIYENQRTGTFTQTQAGGEYSDSGGQSIQAPNYVDDYNIFQPYLRIVEAILTQNPPGIDFRPDNPNRSEDTEAAETAEGYRLLFNRSNNVKQNQTQIVRMMGVSARTVLWTRTEANGQKFGFNPDTNEPKQMEICTVHGTLETKVPIVAKCLGDCLYCFISDDPDVKQAKSEYPKFEDKIKASAAGLGENAYERIARLGVLQGTRSQAQIGDALTHLTTRMHAFLRPASFIGKEYDQVFEEGGGTVGEKLKELFPLGCHAVFIGDTYCGSWAECMDDHLVIGFPYEGDGMFRLAIMDPMVVVQDRFNDNMNAAAEVWDHGWPSTWINADDVEYDAISSQKADPYAIRQKKSRTGMPLDQEFFREPDPELPASFLEFTNLLQGELAQFMLATPPAVFGAAQADQKTASGYAQARAQAMGQLGLIWGEIQGMMAKMYEQAAKCAAKNPDHSEEIVIPAGNGQNATIHMERLSRGKFGCYPDEDSSFPESTDAKRQTLTTIFAAAEQSPDIGMQIMQAPDNWQLFNTILGMPELVIPEAEARNKQAFEIEELLQNNPIPPDPQAVEELMIQHAAATVASTHAGTDPPPAADPQTVMQSLMKPSVPVDELDFHEYEFLKCKDWLTSSARRRADAEGNQAGVLNVKLHALEHQKMMILQAPPPVPMGAPPPAAPHGAPPKAGGPTKPPGAAKAPPNITAPPPGAPGQPTM